MHIYRPVLVLIGYPPPDFKILFSVEKKCGGGFWRAPDPPPTPFVNPLNKKNFDFQGSPLWFFNVFKIWGRITDKYPRF